jgi:acyl-homoserine-lactone acylase
MRIGIWAAGWAALLAAPAAHANHRYDATITRTTYGIPHIKASRWDGVGYGVANAYAEDNLCLLAEEFATVAGERSRHWGPEGKAVLGFQEIDNLASDLFFRATIDLPALREGFARQGRAARALAEGYVAGYNRFLKDAGAEGIPAQCRGKDWVRPITLDDVLRLTEKQMLLASSRRGSPGPSLRAALRRRSPCTCRGRASLASAAMAGPSAARPPPTGVAW